MRIQTTVGDLIAALSKYDSRTPIFGLAQDGVSSTFSIQEAHNVDGSAVAINNVSLHSWPDDMDGKEILGYVDKGVEILPRITAMESLPANSNPYRYDLYHMGVGISGPLEAMYCDHPGFKTGALLTEEERAAGNPVYHDDPKYLIIVNKRTGQRFKIVWDLVAKTDVSEAMNAILVMREANL